MESEACLEHCAPFGLCFVAWVRLDWPVESGGSLAKPVGVNDIPRRSNVHQRLLYRRGLVETVELH